MPLTPYGKAESEEIMPRLWITETWVDVTRGCQLGESDPYETAYETPSELFRSLRKEYGGKVSRMFVDSKEGPPKHVGWVFKQRRQYEDTREPFVRETWITVLSAPDEVTRKRNYVTLGGKP